MWGAISSTLSTLNFGKFAATYCPHIRQPFGLPPSPKGEGFKNAKRLGGLRTRALPVAGKASRQASAAVGKTQACFDWRSGCRAP